MSKRTDFYKFIRDIKSLSRQNLTDLYTTVTHSKSTGMWSCQNKTDGKSFIKSECKVYQVDVVSESAREYLLFLLEDKLNLP